MFRAHPESVVAVALCPWGPCASSACSDVVLWSGDRVLRRLGGHVAQVTSVATNSTIVASASRDGTCRLWQGNESRSLVVHHPIRRVALSEGLVATRDDYNLTLWRFESDDIAHTMPMAPATPTEEHSESISFSSDGRLLATASGSVLDVSLGTSILDLPLCHDVCFHGPNCIAIAKEESIVIDVRCRTPVWTGGPPATRVAWCKETIGCLRDGELSFWSVAHHVADTPLTTATCIAGDDRSFVVGDADGLLHTWGDIREATVSERAHVGLCGDAIDTAKLPTSIASTLTSLMSSLRAVNASTVDLARRLDVSQAKLEFLEANT
eukprot:GEMP01031935.1.p1 GENE.GEMP01031935.1~~GEMP01031935.1.p1  ORF type:complete len:338 (+),score=101.66 GEMP01031935.1:44-1015(+)